MVPAIGRHAHRLQVVRECRRRACSRAAAATPATLRPDLAELRPPRRLKPPSTAHGANTIAATALPAIRLEPRAVAAAKPPSGFGRASAHLAPFACSKWGGPCGSR